MINSALAMGVAYVIFWETFCNECLPGPGCGPDGRCREQLPVTDPQRLNGFWLVRPDGSHAWPWRYLQAKLHQAADTELLELRRDAEPEVKLLDRPWGYSSLDLPHMAMDMGLCNRQLLLFMVDSLLP